MVDPSPSTAPPADDASSSQQQQVPECPFCVMMRKGGCEETFKAFMECGERAEKGGGAEEGHEMSDCVPFFESLHACMDKNKAVFDVLLEEMRDGDVAAAADGSEQQKQEDAAPAAAAAAAAPVEAAEAPREAAQGGAVGAAAAAAVAAASSGSAPAPA